ncbi:hypothetical protein F0562_009264 [Nyssa sinensis]|uniref:Uncharacterized protein n=1 Tax=Nyssa sinensis TaxID=561372 RepID=A0A5J5A0F8_9ASTE|nr:hypothetical protein F0562_009264 [Nyssa sinensis]
MLLPVSDCDQVNALNHVLSIYFYRPTSSFSIASAIGILRNSLSQALVHFYQLAGRLHWTGNGGRLGLECNAMGALLYQAETNAKIDDFALAVAISHIIVDGASALHFIAEWARIARGESLDMVPFFDRTLLLAGDPPTPPRFDHAEFSPPPLLIGQSDNTEERKKETTVTMLQLSKEHVEKLKKMANDGRSSGFRAYSRYEVVAGHMWRCACRAREHENKQLTKLRVAVNIRMRPPLPKGYFGNAVLTPLATSQAGELVSRPLGYAAGRIREAVEMITDEYVRSSLDFVRSQSDVTQFRTFNTAGCTQGAFFGNPNLEITSWMGLSNYNTDFGWGKEIYMGPGALGYDGKSIILSSHEEDGSLVIALRTADGPYGGF